MSDLKGRKRKPGAQVGNLNAMKTILPAIKRIQAGRPLPAYLERVTALVEAEKESLISDKGGWDNMSGAEQLMVSNWKSARQCELLIWFELIEKGAVTEKDGSWDLQPGLQRLASFLSAQRMALQALGLERRAKPVMSVQDYLANFESKEEKETENGN